MIVSIRRVIRVPIHIYICIYICVLFHHMYCCSVECRPLSSFSNDRLDSTLAKSKRTDYL